MDKKRSNLVKNYLLTSDGCGMYDRYPDISDRAAWESLSDEVRTKLIKAGEEARKEPWTQLLISDFREFSNEELKEAVEFAHLHDAKVYVTFNILIQSIINLICCASHLI